MATLDYIISNFQIVKEGGLTHRRHFLNLKETGWDSRNRRTGHGNLIL